MGGVLPFPIVGKWGKWVVLSGLPTLIFFNCHQEEVGLRPNIGLPHLLTSLGTFFKNFFNYFYIINLIISFLQVKHWWRTDLIPRLGYWVGGLLAIYSLRLRFLMLDQFPLILFVPWIGSTVHIRIYCVKDKTLLFDLPSINTSSWIYVKHSPDNIIILMRWFK